MVGEIASLIREVAARFDRATMDGPTPQPPAGMRLELSCSAPGTASVVMHPSDDDINVYLGETTWIELPRRKLDRPQRVQEVRRILDAVVNGRFEETIWRVGGAIVRSKAALYTLDQKAFLKPREWRGLANLIPDPRATRTHIKYEPYS